MVIQYTIAFKGPEEKLLERLNADLTLRGLAPATTIDEAVSTLNEKASTLPLPQDGDGFFSVGQFGVPEDLSVYHCSDGIAFITFSYDTIDDYIMDMVAYFDRELDGFINVFEDLGNSGNVTAYFGEAYYIARTDWEVSQNSLFNWEILYELWKDDKVKLSILCSLIPVLFLDFVREY